MFPWNEIDTVLLDMDGTLLDLHFDNHFWLQIIPHELSQERDISVKEASEWVEQCYANVEGTLNWYCLDYWQQQMGLDIMALHRKLVERIQLRQDSMPFLDALKRANKSRILVTNAHPKNLALKLEHTDLSLGLDHMISSHETGYPKEHPLFWQHLFLQYKLDPSRCLFIDDNEAILQAARLAGVGYQLGIANPDSQKPNKIFDDFPAIEDYHHLLDELIKSS
ncbi:GMP/IMP nucleotidase [Shewanella schlegeliana]|uniref:GMP/IMP nucleotidase n=1 Tax=Shewanella schlegeliana TaxID=190308 RepID=A0ABS1T3D1_9GAMM|nr:GMP/IMP nucleotidase [Shewanella schlegeliana]MBL4915301.1 GMP/IMP nucleotidase [Shewanella schlegeliana]MCL1111188.1 GMP/IMP nucleotidase [Shewanella schlegeliana]GIU34274.1 nucleotidase [Shewanella schlegeliana]